MRARVAGLLAVALAGCAALPQSLRMPADDTATLVVGSVALFEPLSRVARHAFFVGRDAGSREWRTWEFGGGARVRHDGDGDWVENDFGPPLVHKVWRGARASELIACLTREAPAVERWIGRDYRFYPGPNSNTFVDTLLRRCHMGAGLPATCVGRDWRGAIGVSVTSSGTGVQFETPLFGIRIGLAEGIEVHLFALSFGIDFWPPAIIVPFGGGRIGFDDR